MELTFVSPVYQAEELVEQLVESIIRAVDRLSVSYEIILVEDGSRDRSWGEVEKQCRKHRQVKGIRLSRNFGQHAAILAGLQQSRGEWTVVLDCDLQDRPEEIGSLYRKAQEGYEIVLAARIDRQHALLKRIFSRLFYALLSWLSGTHYDGRVANFGIYHRKVIDAILQFEERSPYFTAMVNWVGFSRATIPVQHGARPKGKSAYTFRKLLRLAIDAILAYSDKPLKLIVAFGMTLSLLAFAYGSAIICISLQGKIAVSGYASVITAICFFSGLIILVLGIVGLYVGKIFERIKGRPAFIVSQTIHSTTPMQPQ